LIFSDGEFNETQGIKDDLQITNNNVERNFRFNSSLGRFVFWLHWSDVSDDVCDQRPQCAGGLCVSDVSAYGPDNLSYTVSRAIGIKLAQGVKKIKLVPSSKVESWIDQNGWDELDFEGLAKGIGADRVIAVELASYSIKDGATMYKGRSDVTVTVYDLDEPGSPKVAYGFGPQEFEFPKNGRPAIQTSDRKFEAFYLSQLTQHITNHFVEHDRLESVAVDAMMDSDF
jgi:hypothetical protein